MLKSKRSQRKHWIHKLLPKEPKILSKYCLPAKKAIAAVFWDRKGVLMVEGV
jgi:hypothetical protein